MRLNLGKKLWKIEKNFQNGYNFDQNLVEILNVVISVSNEAQEKYNLLEIILYLKI